MRSLQKHELGTTQRPDSQDGMLLREALKGDQDAFAALVVRYQHSLFCYIGSILKDREQSYDVLQFVFLQLYLTLPTLKANVPLKAWLFRVARNRSLDELRKRRYRRVIHFSDLEQEHEEGQMSVVESIPDPHPLPEEVAEQMDLQGSLQRALFVLPPTFRVIVLLRSVYQLSFPEIARTLHKLEPTVKICYYRSLVRLRTTLKQEEEWS